MIVRYFSDLHLEFIKPIKINKLLKKISPGLDEICILAGDIGNPYHITYDIFMKFISKNFKKTFIIAGNHEYYNTTKSIQETNEYMKNYFDVFDNISFLNNTYEMYNNYCFIGTTLWSHISNPTYKINDVDQIPNFDFTQYNELNKLCIDFLENTLQNNTQCIIITHHVPSFTLIDPAYKTAQWEPYNQWFCCDMDNFINKYQTNIQCWIYGHTHKSSNVTMSEIPILCNPIGYPGENSNIDFTTNIIVE